ncbi:MAG TPA: DUF1080 domain-containing protein [Candidatus Limnocylindria bacterium]|jgi:hypothetical protein|nr:DUF1080 domain-containing protein [Candidatus Limnocylindria bacterium]
MKIRTVSLATLVLGASFALLPLQAADKSTAPAKAAPAGFVSLFDGKTLNGWSGLPDHWKVEEGSIIGYTTKDNPLKNNTFLVWTNGVVDNFELHFKYRIFRGNSGVQYRSTLMDPEKFIVGGYQADIEAGKTYSGILYEERMRGILAERGQRTVITEENGKTKVSVIGKLADSADLQAGIRSEDWNDYIIIADGNHLIHMINGRATIDVMDEQASKAAKSGILGLQIHVGEPMMVQFKEIKLKRLQ